MTKMAQHMLLPSCQLAESVSPVLDSIEEQDVQLRPDPPPPEDGVHHERRRSGRCCGCEPCDDPIQQADLPLHDLLQADRRQQQDDVAPQHRLCRRRMHRWLQS